MQAKDIKIDQEYCVVRNDSKQFRRPGGFSIASIRNSAMRAKVTVKNVPRTVTAGEGWHSWTRDDGIRVHVTEVPETNLLDEHYLGDDLTLIARNVLMPWSEYAALLTEYEQAEAERDAEIAKGEAEREAEHQFQQMRERKQHILKVLDAFAEVSGLSFTSDSAVQEVYDRLYKEDHDA